MDGIRAHCMGTEFPKRDTDSPNVEWVQSCYDAEFAAPLHALSRHVAAVLRLPSAADLDAVAEEQRVKDATS